MKNARLLAALVALSALPAAAAPTGANLYVDSLAPAGGTGDRIDSPVRTVPEALALAQAGDTIWVRGGAGRAYGVTNDVDTLPIPATLEGLSIRAYAETPGDGGLASVAISDTYVADGNRAHIVSNAAANVTIEGFDFSFGTSSVGKQNVGSCAIVRTDAPFTTVENCRFRMPRPTGYAGSGANTALVETPSGNGPTNLVVRGCGFYNTRTANRYHNFAPPVRCANNGLVVGNVFSNVNWTATTRGDRFSFVSNVVYGANEETAGERAGIVLNSGRDAEIAYNVLAADPASDKRHAVFFGFWRAWTGNVLVHHNTCIGGSTLVFAGGPLVNESRRKPKIFCNLFVPAGAGTNIVESVNSATQTNLFGHVPTTFRPGSVFRNNASPATAAFSGGTAPLQVTNYQLVGEDGLFVADNLVLDAPPVFVVTNDIRHADFYRYRTSRTAAADLGVLGWRGENGEYPLYIGAKPPLYPESTMLILR